PDRNAGHRAAERFWTAREAAQLIARRAVSR
ncbi:MAG: hypothetical protein JWM10_246, partial [Myxococcaceae bacterium]|nr:hypothetical protein [Myxococcaceae bacterium]